MNLGLDEESPSPDEGVRFEELPPKRKARSVVARRHVIHDLDPLGESSDEMCLIASLMVDFEGSYHRAQHLTPEHFVHNTSRLIWLCFRDGLRWPDDLRKFEGRTGLDMPSLAKIGDLFGIGIGLGGWIRSIEESYRLRRYNALLDEARLGQVEPEGLVRKLTEVLNGSQRATGRALGDFVLTPKTDKSVLLGDHYLDRGGSVVLSCGAGMGKSSMDLQMAVLFALGRDFFGLQPNGPLVSLIVQAEDSDNDVARVWASIIDGLKLSPEDIALVNQRVIVVSERTRRGDAFIAELGRLIRLYKPDLLHMNPLQAYMDGDVTNSQDLGNFLRGGLNALNDPPAFGYVIIHHSTKPVKAADKEDRLWNEVMYDMAGGAEIINWARGILILRATEDQGNFNLVLAKRKAESGVVSYEDAGTGQRAIPKDQIALRHSQETFTPKGGTKMHRIFWEGRDPDPPKEKRKVGRPKLYDFSTIRAAVPVGEVAAATSTAICRIVKSGMVPSIAQKTIDSILVDAFKDGQVCRGGTDTRYMYYREAPPGD